jgi:hypothetical protein
MSVPFVLLAAYTEISIASVQVAAQKRSVYANKLW